MRFIPRLALVLVWAVSASAQDAAQGPDSAAASRILEHIRVLSSDEFEGRAPGTPGEDKAVAYIQQEFIKLGLKPGNPDGTYIQNVPMDGILSSPSTTFAVGGKTLTPLVLNDYVAVSRHIAPQVDVKDSDIVFVGYGVVAPEYGWDDFKGVDVRGKTVVMLINDPPVRDLKDPSKLDDSMFKGKAMTYYGRWTYKYEEASAKGAAACLIVHETGPAGYPYAVVSGSWGRENFVLESADGNAGRVPIEGWLTLDFAKRLFAAAGQDFDTLKSAAVSKDFRPVAFNAKASFSVTNKIRPLASRNVIAKIEGSKPARSEEYVIYTAHWDHLGRNTRLKGDQIFNGAPTRGTPRAQYPLSRCDRRGAGPPGLGILRPASPLPAHQDPGRHQYRRPAAERQGPGPGGHRLRQHHDRGRRQGPPCKGRAHHGPRPSA